MTRHRGPLSENEKVMLMAVLFPIFWPFIPLLLVYMAAEGIRNAYWDWSYRRAERREAKNETASDMEGK